MPKKKASLISSPILILVLIIFLGVYLAGGVASPDYGPIASQSGQLIPVSGAPYQTNNNLQLNTIQFITKVPPSAPTHPPQSVATPTVRVNTPTPVQYCASDGPKGSSCICPHYTCLRCVNQPPGPCADSDQQSSNGQCLYCSYSSSGQNGVNIRSGDPNCSAYCYAKPVIYLYPVVDTQLTVTLTIPGYVYISDPQIEQTNSWTNVIARPGGKLTYQGKEYSELYYESSVTKHVVPTNGLFIKSSELKEKLLEYTHRLGLLPNEQQEFLEYWMPKLKELNSPYIFFSVLTPQEKDSVDHVELSVEPQTRIEFLAYFKPVSALYSVEKLKLPTTPPKRLGFTEVEWGGTIDK